MITREDEDVLAKGCGVLLGGCLKTCFWLVVVAAAVCVGCYAYAHWFAGH